MASPALISACNCSPYCACTVWRLLPGQAFIMALMAVGNKKVWVTPHRPISCNAPCGSKRPAWATMVQPKYSVGSSASIRPPVQAQSAGDQNTARESALPWPSKPNQFWLQTKPVRLPISARCGSSAPLGLPVVPLV